MSLACHGRLSYLHVVESRLCKFSSSNWFVNSSHPSCNAQPDLPLSIANEKDLTTWHPSTDPVCTSRAALRPAGALRENTSPLRPCPHARGYFLTQSFFYALWPSFSENRTLGKRHPGWRYSETPFSVFLVWTGRNGDFFLTMTQTQTFICVCGIISKRKLEVRLWNWVFEFIQWKNGCRLMLYLERHKCPCPGRLGLIRLIWGRLLIQPCCSTVRHDRAQGDHMRVSLRLHDS